MYSHILLAVDGSRTSDVALREAARLVGTGTRLHLITVIEDPYQLYETLYGIDATTIRDAIVKQGQAVLDRARDQLAALGVSAEPYLADMAEADCYNVPDTILACARRCQAELIVLGTHGRRGFKRFFLGSVAEQVIRSATLPVLLVRDPEAAAADERDDPDACPDDVS